MNEDFWSVLKRCEFSMDQIFYINDAHYHIIAELFYSIVEKRAKIYFMIKQS